MLNFIDFDKQKIEKAISSNFYKHIAYLKNIL